MASESETMRREFEHCMRTNLSVSQLRSLPKSAWNLWQAACDRRTPSAEAKDASRYRWLRQHFRFANDSMHEIWFDASLEPNDSGVPEDLDQELDAAIAQQDAQRGGDEI